MKLVALFPYFLGIFVNLILLLPANNAFAQVTTGSETINRTRFTNQTSGRIWNLQDAEILSIINEVSQETGKNFVVDPRVSGKISLISTKPIQKNEVYQVFLSILGILGYSAIPSGNVVKIVPNMDSGELATPVGTKYAPGRGDDVVVRVIPLENVSATQLLPILRPLLPQWSNITAYTPGNVIILLGRAANLQRIIHIIREVDHASSNGIQIVRLHKASAIQVAAVLNNLQNAARAAGETPGLSIGVDEPSNSILLGGPRAMRLRMQVLIAQLDATTSTPAGNTEVIYLRYLKSKKFAPLLGRIAQNIIGKNTNDQSNETFVQAVASRNHKTTGSAKSINSSIIQDEPNTNALIITAPPSLMAALKNVIAKLDIRPAEVLVEAIIAEINENDLNSLGIQWGTLSKNGQVESQGSDPTSFPQLDAGVIGIIPHARIKAVLSALHNMNGVDILSTPSIVVLDNQKAMIEIGQDVPIKTGEYTTPNSSAVAQNDNSTLQPFNTISMKPVTLRLDVTPQINLSNAIRMQLKLKNDSLQNPQNPTLTPRINTSKIQNSVIINNGDILVLGGLISNANNENINKVPILGDVPIFGPLLFQQKSRSVAKKTLMVFIKPIIMHSSPDGLRITHVKYDSVRKTQANMTEDLLSLERDRAETRLPPWRNTQDLPKPFEHGLACDKPPC